MNIVLVPALLLLVGFSIYKKVIEPRRTGEQSPKPGKGSRPAKAAKAQKAPRAPKALKASKSSPTVSSGRMGSVL